MKFNESLNLQKRFNDLIPGGSHTYAKGDDQFPESMPVYIDKGKGCHVWDVDGNEYIEYALGLRSVTLGHNFEPIVNAACRQMLKGTNFGRPAKIELECAEAFLDMFENAEMVKFSKNGSDATNGAIKLARSYTGRNMVGICADHPFFSVDDWFISTTPMNSGIPEMMQTMVTKFQYNDLESIEKIFSEYPNKIACIILEPEKYEPPKDDFLNKAKEICHNNGALFILDEMITGFRWHNGGAQKVYNVVPDLSTFGKAMGNGFSIAALAGKKEFMELGGILHKKERVFLMSTTHGAESHALAAAIATMKFYHENDVIGFLYQQGSKLKEGVNRASRELGIEDKVSIIGIDCCSVYTTRDNQGNPSQPFRTLFIQEQMKRGLLMPSSIVSFSHSDKDISDTVEKMHDAMIVYKKALDEGIDKYLIGRPVAPVWRKYN
ncbi:MAG: glutamate-1-semialdehyde 2,1-aminomutase [Prolixibacteraceae bacterium]|nr:glutamate-1-semialdehyde 2,1-aminomutase [Prolixibacteraceae bacterium]